MPEDFTTSERRDYEQSTTHRFDHSIRQSAYRTAIQPLRAAGNGYLRYPAADDRPVAQAAQRAEEIPHGSGRGAIGKVSAEYCLFIAETGQALETVAWKDGKVRGSGGFELAV
jgi:hypothetical protein